MEISIYTDGSSLGNPGPGGYAALLHYGGKEIVVKGGEPMTTNNRMEMRALIEALKKIPAGKGAGAGKIDIYSDSSLIIKTLNRGWKKKENIDLWMELESLIEKMKNRGFALTFHWVKGHAGHPENTRCDEVAVAEAKKYAKNTNHSDGHPVKTAQAQAAFFCQRCGKPVRGKLKKLPESGLIRADCELCGKFIKFAKHTKKNLSRIKNVQETLF